MIQIQSSLIKLPLIALLLAIIVSLTACFGDSKPSESDVKAMAAQYFDKEYSGLFTASNVIKNNGYKQNDTHYVAELTITGTALTSLEDYAKSIMNDASMSSIDKITSTMSMGMLKLAMPAFQKGDQLDFEKHYLFINTDNGWQLKKELDRNNDTHPLPQ